MRNDGLVILGASGTLGDVLRVGTSQRVATRFLFDKNERIDAGIAACNLLSESEITAAVNSVPISSCSMWRLVTATGLYNGSSAGIDASWEDTHASLQVNLIGLSQFVISFIWSVRRARKKARIVILSSAAAHVGSRDIGYGIAKAGLNGLVRSASKRYAQDGITIIGVAPGLFPSAMSRQQDPERKMSAIAEGHIGRPAELEEVVKCVEFALFEAPDALTGTFISPNGGQVS